MGSKRAETGSKQPKLTGFGRDQPAKMPPSGVTFGKSDKDGFRPHKVVWLTCRFSALSEAFGQVGVTYRPSMADSASKRAGRGLFSGAGSLSVGLVGDAGSAVCGLAVYAQQTLTIHSSRAWRLFRPDQDRCGQ